MELNHEQMPFRDAVEEMSLDCARDAAFQPGNTRDLTGGGQRRRTRVCLPSPGTP